MYPSQLAPGTVVAVPFCRNGVRGEHVGIVTEVRDRRTGEPTVISASKKLGYVGEEWWSDFSDGQAAQIVPLRGRLASAQVLRRARSQLGRPWRLFSANCEHFVRWVHGVVPKSPQVRRGLAIAGVVGVAGVALGVIIAALLGGGRRR